MSLKKFQCQIEVRFADIDAYGHVNNAKYFTYLETARTKIFMENFVDFMNEGILFIVVRAECDFKKPIRLNDPVQVSMWMSKVGKTSFEMDYLIETPDGKLYATAKTVMVAYDQAKSQPTALPEKFIEMVSP